MLEIVDVAFAYLAIVDIVKGSLVEVGIHTATFRQCYDFRGPSTRFYVTFYVLLSNLSLVTS